MVTPAEENKLKADIAKEMFSNFLVRVRKMGLKPMLNQSTDMEEADDDSLWFMER